jgi:hypothetical protein
MGYDMHEAALVLCLVSLMATIIYAMIPDRRARRRAEAAATPTARVYRPLWADRPTSDPVLLDLAEPVSGDEPAMAAAA